MKLSKEEQARREGMSYALRYAKEHGIDKLEEELKYRNAFNVPLKVSNKDLNEFTNNAKLMMLDTVLIMTCSVLHDKFGFGKKRLSDFTEQFNFRAECIGDDYVSWQDLIEELKEECGLEYSIRMNDRNVEV